MSSRKSGKRCTGDRGRPPPLGGVGPGTDTLAEHSGSALRLQRVEGYDFERHGFTSPVVMANPEGEKSYRQDEEGSL